MHSKYLFRGLKLYSSALKRDKKYISYIRSNFKIEEAYRDCCNTTEDGLLENLDEIYWTDSVEYADAHYGEIAHETTRHDKDWD